MPTNIWWLMFCLAALMPSASTFTTVDTGNCHKAYYYAQSQYSALNSNAEDFSHDFQEEDLQTAGVVLEDLNWRVEKLRLEEENKTMRKIIEDLKKVII